MHTGETEEIKTQNSQDQITEKEEAPMSIEAAADNKESDQDHITEAAADNKESDQDQVTANADTHAGKDTTTAEPSTEVITDKSKAPEEVENEMSLTA